jgi:hypothetical protein
MLEPLTGNRADVTTLETVMRMVERKYGQARRVWVFDRGIVSDANLAAIRRRGGQYLVGTRRTTLRHVEQALLEGPWTQVRDEVEAQLIPIPGGTETYVLCRSTARREKELAIRRRFSTRLEDRLRGLGDLETSAPPPCDGPHPGARPGAARHPAERGYYLADDRRPRDPTATCGKPPHPSASRHHGRRH